jgi:hypothetical protein
MTDHVARQGTALPVPLLRAAAGQAPADVLALLAGPVGAAVAQAAGYAGQALSENTRRAYAADWKAFAAWCAAGAPPSPVISIDETPPGQFRSSRRASTGWPLQVERRQDRAAQFQTGPGADWES